MATQPTKRVEFFGVNAGLLGLCVDADGKVVAAHCGGYEVASVEIRPSGTAAMGTWTGALRQSNFPGGGFAFYDGNDTLNASSLGIGDRSISTEYLVLQTTAVQAGAAFDVVFDLSTRSE